MSENQDRLEQFRRERLVRLDHTLRPLATQGPEADIPLVVNTLCASGHRVTFSIVPSEWKEAVSVSPSRPGRSAFNHQRRPVPAAHRAMRQLPARPHW